MVRDSLLLKDSVRLRDSVVTKVRDSVVIIPKSNITTTLTKPCGSTEVKAFDLSLGSGPHQVRVWSDGTNIYVTSQVDSLISRISEKETLVLKERERYKELQHKYDSLVSKTSSISTKKTVTKPNVWAWSKGVLFGVVGIIITGIVIALYRRFSSVA